jgi:hypothetical protein
VARLALRQIHQFGDVPADEVVLLSTTDRPGERALDLHQRRLAEHLRDVPEETARASARTSTWPLQRLAYFVTVTSSSSPARRS